MTINFNETNGNDEKKPAEMMGKIKHKEAQNKGLRNSLLLFLLCQSKMPKSGVNKSESGSEKMARLLPGVISTSKEKGRVITKNKNNCFCPLSMTIAKALNARAKIPSKAI